MLKLKPISFTLFNLNKWNTNTHKEQPPPVKYDIIIIIINWKSVDAGGGTVEILPSRRRRRGRRSVPVAHMMKSAAPSFAGGIDRRAPPAGHPPGVIDSNVGGLGGREGAVRSPSVGRRPTWPRISALRPPLAPTDRPTGSSHQ